METELDKLYERIMFELDDFVDLFEENRNKQAQFSKVIANYVILFVRNNYSDKTVLTDNKEVEICHLDVENNKISEAKSNSTVSLFIKEFEEIGSNPYGLYNQVKNKITISVDREMIRVFTNFENNKEEVDLYLKRDGFHEFHSKKEFLASIIRHELNHEIDLNSKNNDSFTKLLNKKFQIDVTDDLVERYRNLSKSLIAQNKQIFLIRKNFDLLKHLNEKFEKMLNVNEISSYIVELNSMITKINTVKNRNSKFPKRTGQIRYFNRLGSLLIRANENFIDKNINSKEYAEKLKICITELNLFALEVYIKSALFKYPKLSKELNGGTFRVFDKQFCYDLETETIKQKV